MDLTRPSLSFLEHGVLASFLRLNSSGKVAFTFSNKETVKRGEKENNNIQQESKDAFDVWFHKLGRKVFATIVTYNNEALVEKHDNKGRRRERKLERK